MTQSCTYPTRRYWPVRHALRLLFVWLCLSPAAHAQFTQQGNRLVGTDANKSKATARVSATAMAAVADGPTCSSYTSVLNSTGFIVGGVYAVGNSVYAATDNELAISTDGGLTFGAAVAKNKRIGIEPLLGMKNLGRLLVAYYFSKNHFNSIFF